MSRIIVATQAELDAALAKKRAQYIIINAPKDLRLTVGATGEHWVVLQGGTVQRVWQGGTVQRVLQGGTVQEVWQGGTVQRVLQGGTVQRVLQGGTVQRVWQGGTVQRMLGASVIVRAEAGAVIEKASPLATVIAYGNVSADAARLVDMTEVDERHPATWCEINGVDVVDGEAVLFKALDSKLRSGHGFEYPIGETVACLDWVPNDECGNGLHVSPTPRMARYYFGGAERFAEVRVPLDGVRPLLGDTPKAKFEAGRVVAEVDIDGARIEVAA